MTVYETILDGIRGEFEQQAKCLVDDASDTAIKFKVIASELAGLYEQLAHCERQIFPDTAEGDYLARHGAVRGILRKSAAPASGEVIFHCSEAAAERIPIPAGTLLGSSQSDLVFRTVADAAIEIGATSAAAAVESQESGSGSNLAAGLLDLLITPIIGVTAVENPQMLAGGSDEESEERYRERVLEAFRQVSNGANLQYYEQFARSMGGVWFAKASFVSGTPNQIRLCVENAARTLSDSIVAALQEEVESVRELNMKVTVHRPVQKAIDLAVTLQLENTANAATLSLLAEEVLRQHILDLPIGESFSPIRAGRALLEITGVRDVQFTSPNASVAIGAGEIAVPGTLSVGVQS